MFLDTSAYTALNQGNSDMVEVLRGAQSIFLSLPVIAELRYGFVNGSKAEHNEDVLQKFLATSQVLIASPTMETTKHYANLQTICRQSGRALSHNDIWIAAIAYELSQTLVTFDQDFTVFNEIFGKKLIILN